MNKRKRKSLETKKTGRTRLRKLDTRSPKEKWLASLASRPLLDLKQRNRAVHNYSKVNFSKRATEVLGLGFKFRPTLKPPKQDDLKSQSNAFCHSVRLNTHLVVNVLLTRMITALGYMLDRIGTLLDLI